MSTLQLSLAQTTLSTGAEGTGICQLQINKKTRGGRETRNRARRMNLSSGDLSSSGAYSVGTLTFICDTLCYHSGGCCTFERLLSDGRRRRRREEALAGLQRIKCWWGEEEQSCAPNMAKLPPFVYRKVIREKHWKLPFLFVSFYRDNAAVIIDNTHFILSNACWLNVYIVFFGSSYRT